MSTTTTATSGDSKDPSTSDTAAEAPTTTTPPKAVHDDPKEAARLCNQWVASGIAKNPSIQFLLKTLVDSGCTPPDRFIRCAECAQPQAGGFGMLLNEDDSGTATSCQKTAKDIQNQIQYAKDNQTKLRLAPDIFVCQQYMENESMVHRTIHHELIHAVDLCRTNMNPVENCVQLACTEIRAENLSGECRFWKELPHMKNFAGHGSACVERRAILSVRANPNCTDRAKEYVQAALPRCSKDYYPYDRHPNEK